MNFYQDWSDNGNTPTSTVADYINNNRTEIIGDMTPQTYNIREVYTPTNELYQLALDLIVNEYGDVEITVAQETWLYNDIITGFYRLIQLLTLEAPVRLEQLLTAPFSENRYTADSIKDIRRTENTRNFADDSTSSQNMTNRGMTTQDNSLTSNSQGTTSQDYQSEAEQNATRNYQDNVQGNSSSTNNSGQVTSTGTNLNYLFPRQATTTGNAATGQFPVQDGVRSLSAAFADSGNTSDQRVDAVTNTSQYQNTNNTTGNYSADNTTETQVQNVTTDTGNLTQNVTNLQHTDNTADTASTTSRNTLSSDEGLTVNDSSRALGQRIRGYRTNTSFGNQFVAFMQIMMEAPVAFDWWLDRFSWIRGIY